MISYFLSVAVDYAWGMPLVILLIGGGAYLLFLSRFLPLKGFVHAFRLISGKIDSPGGEGQISHFQGLCTALSATIGLGNISGVAVAITQGGAGAIFWMWVAALIGMNTKFFECTLSLMHRGHDYRGEVQGGPMYVITKALSPKFHPLAYMFAFCCMIGALPLFNVNQLASFYQAEYSVPVWLTGAICVVIVTYVLMGEVRRIGKTASFIVPIMGLVYAAAALTILALNFKQVPAAFYAIFQHAFTGQAAMGGAVGYAVMEIMKTGIKRAAFSNEAGVGTAPMAHGNVRTSEPVGEGLVAMLGPFFDTIIVCTMTALVILIMVPPGTVEGGGILITTYAFKEALPNVGMPFLSVAIFLFSISTTIGMANYSQKCWDFLFKGRFGLNHISFRVFYAGMVMLGALVGLADIMNLLDLFFALMAIPNMIATLLLARQVERALESYLKRFNV